MDMTLLQRLTAATTDAEREAIVLEMSLSALPAALQEAIHIAAIPHWFDARYLEASLGDEIDALYADLLTQSFVEQIPGKGYAIHERTRRQLLHNLWQDDPDSFRAISGRAAAYCATQAEESDDPEWQAEAIYHQLISDPSAGVDGLRDLATKWANYEYHSYDEIERALRWANEQLEAGRLTGSGADWTRLWQAKLALIYGRPHLAAPPLNQITIDLAAAPYFAAETAQTRGDMFAKTGERAEMETAWRAAYDLYMGLPDGRGQLDAYLVADKIRQHGLAEPDGITTADPRPKTPPSRNSLRLIDNISAAWIDGVLKTALDETIDLRMDRSSGQPANLVYHQQRGMDRAVAAGGRLSRLFDSADRSLLILGAPGSGKTITLLQLLEELLQEARTDADAPIPLLFNLSSFGAYAQKKEADLRGWMAEQAYDQYRLKREETRKQLAEADKFILLLDGLDEVPEAERQREQCVEAINSFMGAYPCGLVVCSRIGDYEALQNELTVSNALVLQPLTNQQQESFITQVGGERADPMLARVQADWQLREALRSPLLLNVYPQVFAALPASNDKNEATVETRRKALFAAYVDSAFASSENDDKREKGHPAAKEKNVHWLSFLGKQMQKHGSSLFFIEEMQPTWLPHSLMRRYRGLYGLLHGLIVGLIGGLIFGLIGGLIFGLIFGFIFGLGGSGATWLTTAIRQPKWRASVGGLIPGLILMFIFGLIGEITFDVRAVVNNVMIFGLSNGLIFGLLLGLLFGLLFGLGSIISAGSFSSWASTIQLRERVVFLWPLRQRVWLYIRQGSLYGLIFGLITGLVVSFIFGLISELSGGLITTSGNGNGLVSGLIFGLIFGLTFVMLTFLDTPPVDKRPKAGEGVYASMRNALRMTLLAILFLGIPTWFIDQAVYVRYGVLFIVLINSLPPIFSWFGGLAWCQHWALRLVIAHQGWLPLRLVPWLDSMAARGLLRRVGGGYIFIHRSLLEYFAELEAW